jgi:iron complex outermembrane receptor protein
VPFRANAAAYHYWINNVQLSANALLGSTPVGVTVNVPREKVDGFELDATVDPADWLSVGGALNYTRARYTNGTVFPAGTRTEYDRVPDTPKWSGSVFADVDAPLSGRLTGKLHGDLYFQSVSYTSANSRNFQGTTLPKYAIANFSAGIEDEPTGLSLTANLKNAFNKVYYTGGIVIGESLGINTLIPGLPRTFTVEARLKF